MLDEAMISIVINADTRPVRNEFGGMFNGVRSRDFIGRSALENKRKFFSGFDAELIVHIDEHEPLTNEQYSALHELCDCVVVRKHSKYYRGANPFGSFNDVSYLQALSMARGTHVAHFDQDMVASTSDDSIVNWMFDTVDSGEKKFVCYPSTCSPAPCHAPEYNNQWWVSTRFFFCRRESLELDVLERAIREPQWLYETVSRPPRENNWTEGFLGVMSGHSVIYPKPEIDRWAIFPWMSYRDGLMDKINAMSHGGVADLIHRAGGDGVFYDGVDANLLPA